MWIGGAPGVATVKVALGRGDKKTKTQPPHKRKKVNTIKVNKLQNTNGQNQDKKAVGSARDYSSTVNCKTKIPTIFRRIFGIFHRDSQL